REQRNERQPGYRLCQRKIEGHACRCFAAAPAAARRCADEDRQGAVWTRSRTRNAFAGRSGKNPPNSPHAAVLSIPSLWSWSGVRPVEGIHLSKGRNRNRTVRQSKLESASLQVDRLWQTDADRIEAQHTAAFWRGSNRCDSGHGVGRGSRRSSEG